VSVPSSELGSPLEPKAEGATLACGWGVEGTQFGRQKAWHSKYSVFMPVELYDHITIIHRQAHSCWIIYFIQQLYFLWFSSYSLTTTISTFSLCTSSHPLPSFHSTLLPLSSIRPYPLPYNRPLPFLSPPPFSKSAKTVYWFLSLTNPVSDALHIFFLSSNDKKSIRNVAKTKAGCIRAEICYFIYRYL
jgi:hypothetical protein